LADSSGTGLAMGGVQSATSGLTQTAAESDLSATADGEVGDAQAIGTPDPPLPAAEQRAIDALRRGDEADFDAWLGTTPDVATPAGWDDARTLRAEFIIQLCIATQSATTRFARGIRIKGARIAGPLDLTTATIDALLLLDRCRIEGDVSLRDATTRLVNLAHSRVVGSIDADRLHSNGGVYLRREFVCEGSVRLSAATIEGDLSCNRGKVLGKDELADDGSVKDRLALRCDRIRVSGSIFMDRFVATGEVRLLDAAVGANVVCTEATLSNPGRIALLADNARIEGSLVLRSWKVEPDGEISLRNASANVLQLGDLTEKWPKPGTVRAQGLRYSALEADESVTLALCERWLDLLVTTPFSPQPYELTAKVLREMGLADDAKKIAIRRRRIQRRLPGVSLPRRAGGWILDRLIGYGYRPGRSVLMLALFAALGTLVFSTARSFGAMVPSDASVYSNSPYKDDHTSLPAGYPPLKPFVYSLDVLLPIVDFQQDSKWRPDAQATHNFAIAGANVSMGKVALYYMWLQIAVGWILSTLLVASVTGLIRKE
jgi:cytoskeletal protein CcmA (bactofilin family)